MAAAVQVLGDHIEPTFKKEPTAEDLYQLGLKCSTGDADAIDYVEAHKWFNLAALRGSLAAKEYRRDIAEHMTNADVAAAQRAAREWLAGAR